MDLKTLISIARMFCHGKEFGRILAAVGRDDISAASASEEIADRLIDMAEHDGGEK